MRLPLLLALALLPGCATIGATGQALVSIGATAAGQLAGDGLRQTASAIPQDPAALTAWLTGPGGLSPAEAAEVVAGLGADARAEVQGVADYVEGAIPRLAGSALLAEAPDVVGPREAARYLLARSRARSAGAFGAPAADGGER